MTTHTFVRMLPIIAATLLLANCSSETPEAEPEASAIEALADRILAATLERYPTMGTYYSIEGARHDRSCGAGSADSGARRRSR